MKFKFLVPYGSRVYGTHSEKSDYDFIAIVANDSPLATGTEINDDEKNIHVYRHNDFQEQLNLHKIHALEAYFHPSKILLNEFKFNFNKRNLRDSISEKASHSYVKAKKKIQVEHDYYIGWKSLFHSLRILMFGIQIAEKQSIFDFSVANKYWFDILQKSCYNWHQLEKDYKLIHNQLSTEFRKVCPK